MKVSRSILLDKGPQGVYPVDMYSSSASLGSESNELPYAEHFSKYGYVNVPNFISAEICAILLERLHQVFTCEKTYSGRYYQDMQVPGAFAAFGEFDCILNVYRARIGEIVGDPKIVCMNSYARIYEKGAELTPHRDKASFSFSATLCITHHPIPWTLGIEDLQGRTVELEQKLGDLMIFRGDLLHWRNGPCRGDTFPQVFLHYSASTLSPLLANPLAGRPCLGPLLARLSPRRPLQDWKRLRKVYSKVRKLIGK